jgi:antitoxin VapB
MATARVFRSGNSQAVRLPKEFRLKGPEVEIFRRGDELVLREKREGMAYVLDILADFPKGSLTEAPADPPPAPIDFGDER